MAVRVYVARWRDSHCTPSRSSGIAALREQSSKNKLKYEATESSDTNKKHTEASKQTKKNAIETSRKTYTNKENNTICKFHKYYKANKTLME